MIGSSPICGIIGAGRAGSALARAMHAAGYRFTWVASHNPADAEHLAVEIEACMSGVSPPNNLTPDIIIIAVPDSVVADAVHSVVAAGCIKPGAVVCHLSGALGVECLETAWFLGASVMAYHPAQTFAIGTGAAAFKGIWFDMEGDEEACAIGDIIARDLGARAVRLDHDQRSAAHLAMSIASNFTVALVNIAKELMERYGIPAETATGMLTPLVSATVENIRLHGTVAALTGPVSRGDAAVVREHLAILDSEPGYVRELYRFLAGEALRIACSRGTVDDADAAAIENLLAIHHKENG